MATSEEINHGIKCKTEVEFCFLPSLNVKSPNFTCIVQNMCTNVLFPITGYTRVCVVAVWIPGTPDWGYRKSVYCDFKSK